MTRPSWLLLLRLRDSRIHFTLPIPLPLLHYLLGLPLELEFCIHRPGAHTVFQGFRTGREFLRKLSEYGALELVDVRAKSQEGAVLVQVKLV